MSRKCLINGTEITIDFNWKFNISINTKTSFNLVVIDSNSVVIEKGKDVKFYDGINLIWAGIITEFEAFEYSPSFIQYNLTITSYDVIVDRIMVSSVYESKSAGYVITDIINAYLLNDGISAGIIQDGLTFDKIVFNYKTAYECFNYICDATPGYNWYIDFNKAIHFYQKESYKCSAVISSSFYHKNFKYHDTLSEYRNCQYLEGGLKKTTLQSDYQPTPKPDGVSRDFNVRFGIASTPVININGTPISSTDIGVNGLDTGKKWYWNYNSKTLTQDSSETVLSVSDTITCTYYGLTSIRMIFEDNAKIAERKSIELNSSGKYEHFFIDESISTNSAAVNYCKGLIEKYSDNKNISLTIENEIGDIEVNKLIFVDKPLFGVYDWYLIESIDVYYQTPEHLTYDIKMISGDSVGGWEDFFKKLTSVQKEINEEDVLIKLIDISENQVRSGIYLISVYDCLYPDDDLYPSSTLYPNKTTISYATLYPTWTLRPNDTLYPGQIGGIKLYD